MLHQSRWPPDSWCWLLGGPLPDTPPTVGDLEFAATLVRRAYQILPHTARRLCTWAGATYAEHPDIVSVRDEAIARRAVARVFSLYAESIFKTLEALDIRGVLLKGSATRLCAYHDPWDRSGEDIDLGVQPGKALETESALMELGFEPSEWWGVEREFRRANVFRRLLAEKDHHELGTMVRWTLVPDLPPDTISAIKRLSTNEPWQIVNGGQLACHIAVDIHHALSNSQSIEALLDSRRWIVRDRVGGWVAARGWILFHATIKLYWEAHQFYRYGLHLLLDVIELLKVADEDDLREFLTLAEEYDVQVPTYYVLRRASVLAGNPNGALIDAYLDRWQYVESSQDPVGLKDMGDMWAKMWGYR